MASQPVIWQNVNMTLGQILEGCTSFTSIHILSDGQPAAIGQPTSHLTICQPDPKSKNNANLTQSTILGGTVHLTKCQLTQSLTECQPDLKPHPGGYIWLNVNLTPNLLLGGKFDQMSAWPPTVWSNVNLTPKPHPGRVHLTKMSLTLSLTKCQPDPKPHQGGYLTKCQSDLKSDKMSLGVSLCLSAERLSEFLNTTKKYFSVHFWVFFHMFDLFIQIKFLNKVHAELFVSVFVNYIQYMY